MADRTYLSWPFFDDEHRVLAARAEAWAAREISRPSSDPDIDGHTREIVRALGAAGWLAYSVPRARDGTGETIDVRSICLLRETLSRRDGLADAAFAMQGLGSAPIALFGSAELRERYLPDVRLGRRVCAFALSEPHAGSDIAAIATTATRENGGFVLDGTKTWISNAGVADQYVVFARTGEPGPRGISAFAVDADTRGLDVIERIPLIAPHPIGTLRLERCRVPESRLIGAEGDGFRIATATLDVFRPTAGAAALGLARRALDEALERVRTRSAFGSTLDRFQIVRERLAQMATDIDAAALLVYRAAWAHDRGADRVTREASMAKLYATEAAGRVVDTAVQLFGALGLVIGSPVERLYREVRALRIYEGTSEIQQLVIASRVLAASTDDALAVSAPLGSALEAAPQEIAQERLIAGR